MLEGIRRTARRGGPERAGWISGTSSPGPGRGGLPAEGRTLRENTSPDADQAWDEIMDWGLIVAGRHNITEKVPGIPRNRQDSQRRVVENGRS